MKRSGVIIAVAFIAFSVHEKLSDGAPTSGQRSLGINKIIGANSFTYKETFVGGRRACVIVVAARRKPTEMEITVKNTRGIVVAKHHAIDFGAAMWYPPRDESYTIIVTNKESSICEFYIALR